MLLDHTMILGWAMPVDSILFCSRMTAYAQTKACVTTFRCCVKYATSLSTLNLLSPEIVEMIVDEIKDSSFRSELLLWVRADRCLRKLCKPADHFSKAELEMISAKFKEDQGGLQLYLEAENYKRHKKYVFSWCDDHIENYNSHLHRSREVMSP